MTLAQELGRFVAGLELAAVPPDVVEKARTCLLNGYGIALGGHATPFAPVARRAALALDGERSGGATLLGDGRKTSVEGAALANAALFHGRAQEDTCGAGHFGTIMIPLLTALVEARGAPVERLLPALIAGYEVGGLLESAYGPKTTPAGLRASPLYGTLAAAAASAHLLGLDAERSAAALANAASFTGGMLQSFADGTDEWRYQVGIAARNGLAAAELARAGSRSAPGAFEGRSGFVRAFARADCDVPALLARLGSEWSVMRVTFKPFPVCAFNQTPVTGALVLRERLGGQGLEAGARADESVRDRLRRHGRQGPVRLDLGHADEHSVLHRADAAARHAEHGRDDDLRRCRGQRAHRAHRAGDRRDGAGAVMRDRS